MFSDAFGTCPAWLCANSYLARYLDLLPEEPTLRFALHSSVVLGLITVAIMLQVLLISEVSNRRRLRRVQFNDAWRPFLALCSISDQMPTDRPTLPNDQRLWWVLQWNRFQQQMRGPARERMNLALQSLDMEPFVLSLLRSGVRKRLIGLTCLRYLGAPRHWQLLVPLLNHRNAIISLSAAHTLIAIDAPQAMRLILPKAAQRPDWALPRLAALCQSAGQAAVTAPLLSTLYLASEAERNRLASLLLWAEPRLTGPWARAQLDHSGASADQVIIALRCLGELNDPRDRARMLGQLAQQDANIRLVAIQAFQRQARAEDVAHLLPLLGDRSWWVRQATADSIAALPGFSQDRLAELAMSYPDRYGQDALRRVIAERAR